MINFMKKKNEVLSTNCLILKNNEEFGLKYEPKDRPKNSLKPNCPDFKLKNYPLQNETVPAPDFINGKKIKNNFAFTCMHFYDCKNYNCLTCTEWEVEDEKI